MAQDNDAALAAETETLVYDGIVPASEDEVEAPDEREPVLTAFLVYVKMDGKAVATSEIVNALATIKPLRAATVGDFSRACHEVIDDVRVMQVTQSVIQTQMGMARQLAEQQEAQRIASLLQTGPNGGRGR